jgi:hypothetical protein
LTAERVNEPDGIAEKKTVAIFAAPMTNSWLLSARCPLWRNRAGDRHRLNPTAEPPSPVDKLLIKFIEQWQVRLGRQAARAADTWTPYCCNKDGAHNQATNMAIRHWAIGDGTVYGDHHSRSD